MEHELDRRWIQLGGVAGIASCLILVAAGIAGGSPPGANDGAAKITQYLADHRDAVLTQSVLDVAGSALALWFVGTLARLLQTRDQRSPLGLIMLAAGAAMTSLAAFDGLTLTALEFLSKQGGLTDAALVQTFFDFQNGIIMPGAFGLVAAVFFVAAGVAMIRHAFAAPWLGWASLAFAVLSVVSGIIGLTMTNGGTTALSFFPAIGFVVIGIVSGVFMLLGADRQQLRDAV
jgi:hypothetical protein